MTNRTITVAAAQAVPIQNTAPLPVRVARMIQFPERAYERRVHLCPELALIAFLARHQRGSIPDAIVGARR